jgi:hypothetical protein
MVRSRKILAFSAFLAITAWANVQLMSCCWFSEKAASLISRIETMASSTAKGHSCCPREKTEATETQGHKTPLPDCGMDTKGHTSVGCKQDESPIEISTSSSFISFPQLILATLTFVDLGENASGIHPPSLTLSASSGPPRYLSLQRILI